MGIRPITLGKEDITRVTVGGFKSIGQEQSIEIKPLLHINQLRDDIERYALSEKKRDAMLKDTHLIEATIQADKIVLSMDETVRHCFGEIAHKIELLALIAWVNPCISEETPINWLQHGAPLERERLLGYREKMAQSEDM
jgi:hypothetical protein